MISDALADFYAHLRENPAGAPRPCKRCGGDGQTAAGDCPACDGTGSISSRRTQSYDDKRDERGRARK